MKVLNVGSLNIDHVYRVSHIAAPGETVAGLSYSRFAGGKGANQSVALARAGAEVLHAGAIGPEGGWLKDGLAAEGVDVRHIRELDTPGGHAVIQVDDDGQNSIVIHGGANHRLTPEMIQAALEAVDAGDMLLLQYETNATAELITRGRRAGLRLVFNPAPMAPDVHDLPLGDVDLLVVNETEGAALTRGASEPDAILAGLDRLLPRTDVCLTLGKNGAVLRRAGRAPCHAAAPAVKAVDSTGAGDTFIGYFLAALLEEKDDPEALEWACRAAALSVTRPGATDAIPRRREVEEFLRD